MKIVSCECFKSFYRLQEIKTALFSNKLTADMKVIFKVRVLAEMEMKQKESLLKGQPSLKVQ